MRTQPGNRGQPAPELTRGACLGRGCAARAQCWPVLHVPAEGYAPSPATCVTCDLNLPLCMRCGKIAQGHAALFCSAELRLGLAQLVRGRARPDWSRAFVTLERLQ